MNVLSRRVLRAASSASWSFRLLDVFCTRWYWLGWKWGELGAVSHFGSPGQPERAKGTHGLILVTQSTNSFRCTLVLSQNAASKLFTHSFVVPSVLCRVVFEHETLKIRDLKPILERR